MGVNTRDDLLAVRTRWQEIQKTEPRPLLSIGLLASYTIDPVMPYLGVALHDAGLPAALSTGPFNQIVQQCLDDKSATALSKPDVLVVAPRFEELATASELLDVVDAAAAAARRWRAFLVVVLPVVPEPREFGHLDDGRVSGVAAEAVGAREAVRASLADRPDAWLVDADQAVRAVGASKAQHAAMFKFARIPYTETVFAELAAQLAGVLRAVYGATPRAVVLDGDSLAGLKGSDVLDEQLRRLHRSGARLALRGGPGVSVEALPELTTRLLDNWVLDCRPVAEQLVTLAEEMGVPTESAVLLSVGGTSQGVRLGGAPDAWPAELRRSGLLDRLPAPEAAPQRAARAAETLSLDDFVAGLGVEVDCAPVGPDSAAKVAEVVSRAKDFTLGIDGVDLTEPGREVLAVRVRDRFGQYGISGAVGMTREGDTCVVDVFSLSCVVLGKGVQDIVLRHILDRPGEVVFLHRSTPHNQITAEFLTGAGARVEEIL